MNKKINLKSKTGLSCFSRKKNFCLILRKRYDKTIHKNGTKRMESIFKRKQEIDILDRENKKLETQVNLLEQKVKSLLALVNNKELPDNLKNSLNKFYELILGV